jgi:protein TonB
MIMNQNPTIMSNFASNLYKSEWIDLVFKNRNKSYGAYMLRSESSSITLKALLLTVPVFIGIVAGPSIYKRLNPEEPLSVETYHPVTIAEIAPAVKHEVKKVELPKAEPELKKIKTVKLTANIAVVKDPVAEPPMLNDIKDAVIGQITQAGEATKAPAAPVISSGSGEGVGVPEADNTVYETGGVDRYPEFEGGMAAWAKFIQRNLRYPSMAQENEVQGKVFISFVVEIDGSISDVKVLKGIGSGCDEEAMRVIRKSPKWKAGQQNDRKVRVRYNMPLAFQLAQ